MAVGDHQRDRAFLAGIVAEVHESGGLHVHGGAAHFAPQRFFVVGLAVRRVCGDGVLLPDCKGLRLQICGKRFNRERAFHRAEFRILKVVARGSLFAQNLRRQQHVADGEIFPESAAQTDQQKFFHAERDERLRRADCLRRTVPAVDEADVPVPRHAQYAGMRDEAGKGGEYLFGREGFLHDGETLSEEKDNRAVGQSLPDARQIFAADVFFRCEDRTRRVVWVKPRHDILLSHGTMDFVFSRFRICRSRRKIRQGSTPKKPMMRNRKAAPEPFPVPNSTVRRLPLSCAAISGSNM